MNALCREACFDDKTGRDRSRPITEQAILEAQERLILAKVTHLDNLADKLREERMRRVIEPILAGADETGGSEEDLSYARDLGLVALEQTRAYLDRCGAEAGHLIVFDARRSGPGEDLPPPSVRGRRAGYGLGHVKRRAAKAAGTS